MNVKSKLLVVELWPVGDLVLTTPFLNTAAETDLLEEIIRYKVGGEPLQKVTERNHDLLNFGTFFAAREKQVRGREVPRLGLLYLKGTSYEACRRVRNKVGRMIRAFKRRP